MALKLRICVRFASTFNVERVAVLTYDLVICKDSNDCLEDRQQIVQIGDTHSDSCSIKCGVPQGSILGPLLFLIYVNDMRAAVSCKLLLYADDLDGQKVGHFLITIQKSFKLIINQLWT